jgi:hypothetical protein
VSSKEQIKTKEDLLKLIFFYYDAYTLRTRKRHMLNSAREIISKMKFNDLINLCKAEGIKTLKSELKDNIKVWSNIWDV